jgi:adenylylsulfate kinase
VLRIGFVANLLTRNGVPVIVSAISPYKAARDQVRREIGEDFIEIFVDCPVEVCAERDVKGLYRRRTLGRSGVHRRLDPYEPPAAPELTLRTNEEEPQDSARRVIEKLEELGYLEPAKEYGRRAS